MLIIRPDFDRRIDLPGVGPCRRPVDIDRQRSGLKDLVSLRVYSFEDGMVIDGEAEDDEVFIVVMHGAADIGVSGSNGAGEYALRASGGSRAVYLPPHTAYQLTAIGGCDVAYARVKPATSEVPAPRDFAPTDGRLEIGDYASAMDLVFASASADRSVEIVGGDGGLPERFTHLRFEHDGAATLSGWPLGDWETAVIERSETATLTVDAGTADILIIAATRGSADAG